MLVRRPPPIFAFIETKVCDDRVAPAITRSAAPAIEVIDGKYAVELKGSIAGTAALMGMI